MQSTTILCIINDAASKLLICVSAGQVCTARPTNIRLTAPSGAYQALLLMASASCLALCPLHQHKAGWSHSLGTPNQAAPDSYCKIMDGPRKAPFVLSAKKASS